jgi:hypothetical protein
VLRRIDRRRIDYVRQLFAELGLPHAQARVRAELAYAALLGGFQLGLHPEGEDREQAARLYHALLIRV